MLETTDGTSSGACEPAARTEESPEMTKKGPRREGKMVTTLAMAMKKDPNMLLKEKSS